jgi:predicted protein tyrosine phosphatase
MFIEAIGRQMAVCSLDGAARLINADKSYWNVISICGPREPKAQFKLARSIHYSCFDDVEEASAIYRSARVADIAEIFEFIRGLPTGPPPAPLLIHCQQGISRSTGVALSWIYGQLPPAGNRLENAVELILELRPQAKPNRLVLGLGLAQFMAIHEARGLTARMLSDPRLARNSPLASP